MHIVMFFRRLIAFLGVVFFTLFPCLSEAYDVTPGQVPEASPFYGETDEDMLLAFNAVFDAFGGDKLCQLFGNEPTYFEWLAEKIMWTDDDGYKNQLKNLMVNYPQTDNGYLWSWGTSVFWPTGDGDMHYDGLFRYINAVEDILRAEGSTDFLFQTDTDTYGSDTAVDASCGRSVYDKCDLIMSYALNHLNGSDGLITITEKSVYLQDGITRFDYNEEGKTLWNNTGKAGSGASNYWDNFCFGHMDAYETALFYHALDAMCYIENAIGNADRVQMYTALMQLVHGKFDETFWDETKGRYIACVDASGVRHDYGLTFLNTEALAYGLGDCDKFEKIFSWLDGERIVWGDTICGDAIRSYTDILNANLKGSPIREQYYCPFRSSTVAVESRLENCAFWWNSLNGSINPLKNAKFGTHLENGGMIFYTFYSEIMARALYGDTDGIVKRCGEIADMYHFNGFESDVGGWAEGLNGEFPENGMVSAAYLKGILGLTSDIHMLDIAPLFPEGTQNMGVDSYYSNGNVYDVLIGTTELSVKTLRGILPLNLQWRCHEDGYYRVNIENREGDVILNTYIKSVDGVLSIQNIPKDGTTLTITKPVQITVTVSQDTKYNAAICSLTPQGFENAGFHLGDACDVLFENGYAISDVPYYNGYYIKNAYPVLVAYPGFNDVRITYNNMGIWDTAGLSEGEAVTLILSEASRYIAVQEVLGQQYSFDRVTYETDEQFCNFRSLTGGNLKDNFLYRGASPVDNSRNRASYTDKLLKDNGIAYVVDLADSAEDMNAYMQSEDFSSDYTKALYESENVVLLDMNSSFASDAYRQKVADGLTQMLSSTGPVYIHCMEGKDRTGFVCMLVEALAGASYEEMLNDYMLTYDNYFSVSKDETPEKYTAVAELYFDAFVQFLHNSEDKTELMNADYTQDAVNYLLSGSMTRENIDLLIDFITK